MRINILEYRQTTGPQNAPAGHAGERGYMLVWAIIIMSMGAVLLPPLLNYLSVSARGTAGSLQDAQSYYAADAGITAVLADLAQGADVLSPGYTLPEITLNDRTVTLSVTTPAGEGPDVEYRYANPLPTGAPMSLDSGEHHTYAIGNVETGSDIQVNWGFTPAAASWTITIYEGEGTSGPVVSTNSGAAASGFLTADGGAITGGAYTIDFHNTSGVTVTFSAFASTGIFTSTWVYVRAQKDYHITATAGNATINAVARQEPGPTEAAYQKPLVTILSWR